MKNISIILCLILLNCFKSINIKGYNSKKHSSNEENENLNEGNNLEEENKKLIKAIKDKNTTKVLEALKNGANINHEDHKGRTPLMHASNTYLGGGMLKILLDAGAEMSRVSIFSENFIFYNFKLIEVLIEDGYIDVNKLDDNKRTLLNNICYHLPKNLNYLWLRFVFKERIMKLFKIKGADFNTQDIDGNTPLMFLTNKNLHFFDKKKYIKILIEFGADINAKNNEGDTALIIVAGNRDLYAVKILLRLDANIFERNNLGEDALISSMKKINEFFKPYINNFDYPDSRYIDMNNRKVIKQEMKIIRDIMFLIIEKGASVNTKTNDGDTPLILATRIPSLILVEALLELNVNIFEKNNSGEDALIAIVRRINMLKIDYPNLKYNRFNHMLEESIEILKKFLEIYPSSLVNVDLLIKESSLIIERNISKKEESKTLQKILTMIFDNTKFIKLLLYKDDKINIGRIICIQNLNLNKDFKKKIMREIDAITSFFKGSLIFENKEPLIKELFSYDTFIFKNKCLLVDAYLNIVKLNKFEGDNDVKEINKLLVDSLTIYYIDKTNNKIGYEDRFLEQMAIIKSKINTFVFKLYNRIGNNRDSIDSKDSSTN